MGKMDLSILVPKTQETLEGRFNQIRSYGIDYSPLDGLNGAPENIDVLKKLELMGQIKDDTDSDLPFRGRSPEYAFVGGGKEIVLGTIILPEESTVYRSLKLATELLGIPVLNNEAANRGGFHGLYGEFHILDSRGVSEEVFDGLNWDSSAIYFLFPSQGYLEQDFIQDMISRCNSCTSYNSQ